MSYGPEEQRQRRAVLLEKKACVDCGGPSPDGSRCPSCREENRERNRQRQAAFREKGLCAACGREPSPGYKTCDACLATRAKSWQRIKDAVFGAYGGYVCRCCGHSDPDALQIDHVNNDGAEHRKQVPGPMLYSWLRKNGFPPGFQVLCANCNHVKAKRGTCPDRPAFEPFTYPC